MRRIALHLLFGVLSFLLISVPGYCAITGLIAVPSSLSYVAPPGSTAIQTDTSPLILASGTGSATLAVGVSVTTNNINCGNLNWLTATLQSPTITGGGTAGVTISVDPTCVSGIVTGWVLVAGGGFITNISVSLYTGTNSAEVSGLSPNSASAGGAAFTLTVSGSGFVSGGSTVEWNGSPVVTTWVSATRLTALIPASLIASQGSASVTVLNTAATASSPVTFTIGPPGPAITALGPNTATAGGDAFTLTVTGTGFVNGGSTVEWNGSPVPTTYVFANQLSASISASLIASPGNVSVQVINTGGAVSAAQVFTVNPAGSAITGISSGSTTLVFESLTGSTQIQTANALVTAGGTGSTGIAVGVTSGTSNGYCPSRTWLSASLTNNATDTIVGGGTAGVTISVDPTCISGLVSGQVGIYTNAGFSTFISVTLYCYTGTGTAVISAVGPNSLTAGGATFSLLVDGSGFVNGGSTIEWNGVPVPTSYISSSQLSASISSSLIATGGYAYVTEVNAGAGASNAVYFDIYPPGTGVTGLTALPASVTYHAAPGSTAIQTDRSPLIVASGAGFTALTIAVSSPTLNLTCGSVTAPWLTATLASGAVNGGASVGVTITVNPCGGSGTLNGQVTVSGGRFTAVIQVTLNINTVVSHAADVHINTLPIMPISLPAGTSPQNYVVGFTVAGQANSAQSPSFQLMASFDNTTNGANWLAASTNGDASDFTLTVDATKLTAGYYSGVVSVVGNDGSSPFQSNVNVTVDVLTPANVISALNPDNAPAGGTAFTLTVNGAGFLNGTSAINWNGSPMATKFVSTTQLTAPIPASSIASAGNASVTVVNAGVSPSNAATFTVGPPPPAITTLSPGSTAAGGGGFTLTVSGSGFVSGGSVIEWSGTALTTTYVSSSQLTATVSASLISLAGSAVVTVLNSGTSPSNATAFPINSTQPPVVSGLIPASATAGGPAFTLTVNGAGFVAGSTVEWNGSPVTTTYVSTSQLTAAIPASLISTSANASITVLNNAGGAVSSALTFAVGSSGPSELTISHIADGGGWRSSILLVNNDTVPALYTVSFHNNAGAAYTPPLAVGATTGSIPVGGSTIIQTADSAAADSEGWAQVSSSQAIGGTAVFRYEPWSQEAAVPLLTTGATKLEIPYQVANGLTLGVALANPSASTDASITETIRDLNGNQLASRTFILQALNHNSFLPIFPANISGGGVVEYDSNVSIYGLGIRSAPQATGLAFTSLDAALLQPASTETISHIVDGGGWRSTIVLVNTAAVAASYTVNFWNDSGASYVPPLASGAVSGSIPLGGTTIIATADTSTAVSEGWATVTSAQTLGGTAVFRYDPWSQEAAVPLLPSGGLHLEIPYQVGNNLTLGIALANPSATQTANITEIIRDQNGNALSTRPFTLAALDHVGFIPTYPANSTGGGVAEYDSDITIYGLGIRSAPQGTGLAFTSVRAVYR